MTKELRKAIMVRSRLKNTYNKKRTFNNWERYKIHRNYCVNLLRKLKKNYFQNLDVRKLTDSREFWKTIKSNFSNKGLSANKLLLKEDSRIISDENELAELLNSYFVNITKDLELKNDNEIKLSVSSSLEEILEGFKLHPSVTKIVGNLSSDEIFSFQEVTETQVKEIILKLDCSKATPYGDIPIKMLKETIDIYLVYLTGIINYSFENKSFPNLLKFGEVCPIFKKKDELDKENYRPVSILPGLSKVFERII